MKEFTFTCGFGDFIMLEQRMHPDFHKSIEKFWHPGCHPLPNPRREMIEEVFKANKELKHVVHWTLPYPTMVLGRNLMETFEILHMMEFHGSSFLRNKLATVSRKLPEKFDVIVPSTPFNVRSHRDIKPVEWDAIIARLEARDTVGIVLNGEGSEPAAIHPRLIDWQGQLNVCKSIEVLKKSSGYIGIDSFMAILAAELHKPEDLIIRTQNPHTVERADMFYAPHETINFLVPAIGEKPYTIPPRPDQETVVIRSINGGTYGQRRIQPNSYIEVSIARATHEIEAGTADLIERLEDI